MYREPVEGSPSPPNFFDDARHVGRPDEAVGVAVTLRDVGGDRRFQFTHVFEDASTYRLVRDFGDEPVGRQNVDQAAFG